MPIQYRFFTIPIKATDDVAVEFNNFLLSVRVMHVHREFVSQGENSLWCISVEYMGKDGSSNTGGDSFNKKPRIDYKEVLPPEDFTLFNILRDWRKETSQKETLPVYNVFNNEQLAAITKKRPKTKIELDKINGIGEAKIEKYGEAVLRIVNEFVKNSGEKKENEAEK